MPMDGEEWGTESDGSASGDYCAYCYAGGVFKNDWTMQQMIDFCVPHMVGPEMTEAEARAMMDKYMPMLKRWRA